MENEPEIFSAGTRAAIHVKSRPRRSARAMAPSCLETSRQMRLLSELNRLWIEACTAGNFCMPRIRWNRCITRFLLRKGRCEFSARLADQVGACAAALEPIHALIRAHILQAERLNSDDTTVPLLATGGARTARLWTYVREDRPFAGGAPPAALFHFSRDREMAHSQCEEPRSAWRLAQLLIEFSTGSSAAKHKLRLVQAGAQSPREAALEITKRLTSIAGARSFITWKNRKALIMDLETSVVPSSSRSCPPNRTRRWR